MGSIIVPEHILSNNKWFKDRRMKKTKKYESLLEDISFINGFENFENLEIKESDKKPLWNKNVYKEGVSNKKSLSVFRLHGCVAWYYQEPLSDFSVEFSVQVLDDIRNYFDRLCVMYPGKDTLIGRDPHAYSFENLYDVCYESSKLVFIGFSFRDPDVVSVVFNAIRQSLKGRSDKKVKIVIVDPSLDKDYFIQRLKSLQQHIPIPLEINNDKLDVKVIRSEFSPKEENINTILNAIK